MKKLFLIPILFLVSISIVSADTVDFTYNYSLTDVSEDQLTSMIEEKRQSLIDYYTENYAVDYPYYYLAFDNVISNNSNNSRLDLLLIYSNSIPTDEIINNYGATNVGSHSIDVSIYCTENAVGCKLTPSHSATNRYLQELFYTNTTPVQALYNPFSYYDSNFTLVFNKSDTYTVIKDNETYLSYSNGDTIPTYRDSNYIPRIYTEINLNNYSYVILSLKSYQLRNNEINQFFTNINTLGQLCTTTVYNYGMQQQQEIYPDSYPQQCTQVYNSFTPVQFYVLKSDLDYKAVYYIKAYNYSIDNKIQVDTSIFNISYVTSANENNPTVVVDGRSYPVIPYNDLNYTAETSTDNNYISGQVCAVGDVNCLSEQTGLDISDLFTQPLRVLQNVWSAIATTFYLITSFIVLIPSPLKEFLISAFFLSIILGILKIIL